jgi:hypothetical protein
VYRVWKTLFIQEYTVHKDFPQYPSSSRFFSKKFKKCCCVGRISELIFEWVTNSSQ